MIRDGFFKVSETGGTLIIDTFFNPITKEEYTEVVRDYEYSDCSRDKDDLYFLEINEEIRREWQHKHGIILVGDTVQVVKGRKIPVGTVAKVVKKQPYLDKYGREQAIYLYFDSGARTNEENCILCN